MILNFRKKISTLLFIVFITTTLGFNFYHNTQKEKSLQLDTTNSFRVAVAANFRSTLETLIQDYKRQHPNINITFSSGSSGSLYQQILHGAPFQLFLSADARYPEQLEKQHKAILGSRRTYALGELVLWSPKHPLNSIKQLTHIGTLALANPKTAPYGRAANEVLTHISLPNLKQVQGHSIAQAHQFVASGNADVGLLARSQVINDKLHVITIDTHLYQPIKQQMILLEKHNAAAKDFSNYLVSSAAQTIIQSKGYKIPSSYPQPTGVQSALPLEVTLVTHSQ